jgi:hypothetical protein
MAEEKLQTSLVQFDRAANFIERYANNVRFEPSVWDLKLIFGELDQKGGGTEEVHLHTAITLPWPTVKLMLHYLQVNVAVHEKENGRITIVSRVWPPDPRSLPQPMQPDLADLIAKIREDFMRTVQTSDTESK